MKNIRLKFIFKLSFSLVLALLVSEILVRQVTFEENPVLRPNFQQFVHNLPTKTVAQIKKIPSLLSQLPFPDRFNPLSSKNPPPWIDEQIKPTIIAYKPPVFYPPSSTPKPTSPPKPTAPLSTSTPANQPSPTYSPTPGGPSPTPTPNTYLHPPLYQPLLPPRLPVKPKASF